MLVSQLTSIHQVKIKYFHTLDTLAIFGMDALTDIIPVMHRNREGPLPTAGLPNPLLDATSLFIRRIPELSGRPPLLSIPNRLTWRSGWEEISAMTTGPSTSSGLTGCFHPLTSSWTGKAYRQ